MNFVIVSAPSMIFSGMVVSVPTSEPALIGDATLVSYDACITDMSLSLYEVLS